MLTNKLEKNVIVYKSQFDKKILEIFAGNYVFDRVSMDLDAMHNRIKYMIKRGKDRDKLPELEEEYGKKVIEMQTIFNTFVYRLLVDHVKIPDYRSVECITGGCINLLDDIMIENVDIDMMNVKFKLIVISCNEWYLKYIDEMIPDDEVYDMYPGEYFRYNTDSYNDGIAKAYPELFENRHTDAVGKGKDGDVFVHNFTFQTSERCNLNCFPAGTEILMSDYSIKHIENIKVGDMVLGIPENFKDLKYPDGECDHPYHCLDNYIPSKVTKTFISQSETVRVIYHYGGEHEELFRVTKDHPFLTVGGEFKNIIDIMEDKDSFIWIHDGHSTQMSYYELQIEPYGVETVYNIETTTHTYVANCAVVHNCTYCLAEGTKITMDDYHTRKNIEDIEVGDIVIGCKEDPGDELNYFFPTKVTKLFHRKSKCYKITIDKLIAGDNIFTYITGEHPVMVEGRGWVHVKDIDPKCDKIMYLYTITWRNNIKGWKSQYAPVPEGIKPGMYTIDEDDEERDVYNFETESHTYVANSIIVHNCYQSNKTNMRMNFETAKKFIDNLLDDKYGYINRYNSPAIIIEFIGGEPFLEIQLTRKIYEYFLDRCYELNHPWFDLHRLSICSNGLLYFNEDVQSFFKDYSQNISFNISIDGNKELHDSCRIQPNGEGSYDIAMAALNHYNQHYSKERNSKMTLAPSNISHLFDSVVDFINNGMSSININCVFEEGWNQKTANIEYYQLKKLADYIIENGLEHIYIAIFNDKQEDVMSPEFDGNSCGGGSASMLALRPNGKFYPCIRYMPTSMNDDTIDVCIGDVENGLVGREEESEIIKALDNNTRRAQSNDICWDCPISNDCANCSALGTSVFGKLNKRTTFACIQFIAEALANVYYWNRLILQHPEYDIKPRINNVPDEWALLIIDRDELDELKLLEVTAILYNMNKDR